MSEPSNPTPLRLGLVQFGPRKARVEENLARIRAVLTERGPDHDLLVFPEAALSGYFLEGGVTEAARTADEVARGLGRASGYDPAPDVVIGFYERWRRRLYNSVGYFTPDEGGGYRVVHVHRKLFLPTYGVFDEARFVETGRELRAVDTRFGRIGLLVCEEAWHSLPGSVLALAGAELILVVSASPARDFVPDRERLPGNLTRWGRIARTMAEEHGVYVAVAQLVGSEGGKLFPGGSLVVGPDGETLARGPLLDETTLSVRLDGRSVERARTATPLLADLEQMLPHLGRALDEAVRPGSAPWSSAPDPSLRGSPARDEADSEGLSVDTGDRLGPAPERVSLELDLPLVEEALVRFIREEVVVRRGFERVVIGVSGGVDSAVSLYLACKALGASNVFGFRMPYRTSSPESFEHAGLVLERTGAQERTLEITSMVDAYLEVHEPEADALRRGNLMARMRAVTLFDQSARLRALPLGTGNKSERLLGYFTWHADDSPPINPLGDLFKTQVWALARHLGVPDAIVDKPATADLVRGVNDEDELGIAYHRADPILYWLLRGWRPDDLVRGGFDADEVALVVRRLDGTHWKRELPTVALLSSTAIGEFYLRPVDY
jgi:NAD+ synthase (glutamine-hydrolysing)